MVFLRYCQRYDFELMHRLYRLYENHLAIIEVGSVITIAFAGLAFFLADHPAAATPALLMAAAGLITAFSGLATAIGGQVIPVIGHWFDARREFRIAEQARANVSSALQSAIDRVAELEMLVRENEKRIIKNSELMQQISAHEKCEVHGDGSKDIASCVHNELCKVSQMISELDAVVRKNEEKVSDSTEIMRQLVKKMEHLKGEGLTE